MPRYCSSLCGGSCLGGGRLRRHLMMALSQIEHLKKNIIFSPKSTTYAPRHLYVSRGIDFVYGVARLSTRLPVQVVALDEYGVIAQTTQPNVPFALEIKLHPFADVQPGPFAVFRPVHVTQRAQTESVAP